MKRRGSHHRIFMVLPALLFTVPAAIADMSDSGSADKATLEKVHPTKPPYSPYAGRNYPTRPFFGDTHLHTAFSMDAGAFGARLSPRDAYRFARGEEIDSSTPASSISRRRAGQPTKPGASA